MIPKSRDRSTEGPASIECDTFGRHNYLPSFFSMALSVVLRVPGLEPSPLTMLLILMAGLPAPCWWPLVVGAVTATDPDTGVDAEGGGGVLPSVRMGRADCGGCKLVSGG